MKRTLSILFVASLSLGCDDRTKSPASAISNQVPPDVISPATVQAALPSTDPKQSPTTATQPTTDPAESVKHLPTTLMMIKDRAFTLEVADDDEEQERGLMFRNSMPEDCGMIFIFLNEAPRGFWMKNTLIPLDIAYLAANGRVLNVLTMKARDESTYASAGPAQYAIELNAGTATRIGLKAGDVIAIPEVLKPLPLFRIR